jgi:hypothetical protein
MGLGVFKTSWLQTVSSYGAKSLKGKFPEGVCKIEMPPKPM